MDGAGPGSGEETGGGESGSEGVEDDIDEEELPTEYDMTVGSGEEPPKSMEEASDAWRRRAGRLLVQLITGAGSGTDGSMSAEDRK